MKGRGWARRGGGREGKAAEEAEAEREGVGATVAAPQTLITGPHAQFNRHKGSERGPCVPVGQAAHCSCWESISCG